MTKNQPRNARYSRVLGIGIAVSIAVHIAAIGLIRLNMNRDKVSDGPLTAVTLQPEETRDELEALDASGAVTEPAPATLQLSSLNVSERPGAPDPSEEYMTVLSLAATAEFQAPLVPRPRMDPAEVESGLTPIHVLEPIALGVPTTERIASGGVGFGIAGLGGDRCVPRGTPGRFPPNRVRFRTPAPRTYQPIFRVRR